MSTEIDELFGEGGGAPEPRTALVWALLAAGLLLSLLGLACTPAPGAVLVLLAWYVIEKERDRVMSGYLPQDALRSISVARIAAFVSVILVIVLFLVQGFLLGAAFYDEWWTQLIKWWLDFAGPPAPDPAAVPPVPGAPMPGAPAPAPPVP